MNKTLSFFLVLFALSLFSGCSSSEKTEGTSATKSEDAATNSVQKTVEKPKEEPKPLPTPTQSKDDKVDLDAISVSKKEVDPKYIPLQRAFKSKKWNNVRGEANKLLSKNTKDAVALNALGAYYISTKKFVAARYFLDLAIKASGGTADIYNNLGLIEFFEGNLSAAVVNFKKGFRKDDKNFNVSFNLGSLYLSYGDFLKALPLLETAFRLRKSSVKAGANYAAALRGAGKIKSAKKVYESVINSEVKSAPALINYARLLIVDFKEYQEGITLLNRLTFLGTANARQKKVADNLRKMAKKRLK